MLRPRALLDQFALDDCCSRPIVCVILFYFYSVCVCAHPPRGKPMRLRCSHIWSISHHEAKSLGLCPEELLMANQPQTSTGEPHVSSTIDKGGPST